MSAIEEVRVEPKTSWLRKHCSGEQPGDPLHPTVPCSFSSTDLRSVPGRLSAASVYPAPRWRSDSSQGSSVPRTPAFCTYYITLWFTISQKKGNSGSLSCSLTISTTAAWTATIYRFPKLFRYAKPYLQVLNTSFSLSHVSVFSLFRTRRYKTDLVWVL